MNLLQKKWILLRNRGVIFSYGNDSVQIENCSTVEATIVLSKLIFTKSPWKCLRFEGHILEGTGCRLLMVDSKRQVLSHITLNSINDIPTPRALALIVMRISPKTKVEITRLEIASANKEPLYRDVFGNNDILLVTPGYPSLDNHYFFGFVHSRLRVYRNEGINVDVAAIRADYNPSLYEYDGIAVFKGNFLDLEAIIKSHHYKVINIHFIDEDVIKVLDKCDLTGTQIMITAHCFEVLYWDWLKFTAPYFIRQQAMSDWQKYRLQVKDAYTRRLFKNPNVHWVFISNWEKSRAEELLGTDVFENTYVIPNITDENIFDYVPKSPEQRKKIFFVKKCDNLNSYSVDVCVRTILELAKRPFFSDLEFSIHGDGTFFDELYAPIKDLSNVKLHKRYYNHYELAALYKENGIALIPTRFDAGAVSMCEAAQSGLAVISSDIDVCKDLLPSECNTLCNNDDPKAFADVVERLYYDPDEFLRISQRMHEKIYDWSSSRKSVYKEIELINHLLVRPSSLQKFKKQVDEPILTIMVPAYNMEGLIKNCLDSLLNHRNAHKLEILVINDGSKDRTSEIAHQYETMTTMDDRCIVKCIDKENGGHGSTINKGMELARGKYFRIVDADDWLESKQLEKLVDILETEQSDVVFTDYAEYHLDDPMIIERKLYEFMTPGSQYDFDDLCYPNYGFYHWGPILSTSNFKTAKLHEANFKIDEKMYYVDMEYDCLPLASIQTAVYYPLNVYRYFVGLSGQSISAEGFKKHYKDHEKMIHRLLDFVFGDSRLTKMRRFYLMERIVMPLVNAHYSILFESVKSKAAFKSFDSMLVHYPEAYHHDIIRNRIRLKLHRKTKGILVGHDGILIWTFNVVKKILHRG